MRVLSFIPALLVAGASFVAAAPAADSNAGSVQAIQDVLSSATSELRSLNEKLTAAGPSPKPADVQTIVTSFTSIVQTTSSHLKDASRGVDLTSEANLHRLGPFAFPLIGLVQSILYGLIPALKHILGNAGFNVVELVNNLLASVASLTAFLHPWGVGTVANILGPVLSVVDNLLNQLGGLLGLPTGY